jgi:hypothetical protein
MSRYTLNQPRSRNEICRAARTNGAGASGAKKSKFAILKGLAGNTLDLDLMGPGSVSMSVLKSSQAINLCRTHHRKPIPFPTSNPWGSRQAIDPGRHGSSGSQQGKSERLHDSYHAKQLFVACSFCLSLASERRARTHSERQIEFGLMHTRGSTVGG